MKINGGNLGVTLEVDQVTVGKIVDRFDKKFSREFIFRSDSGEILRVTLVGTETGVLMARLWGDEADQIRREK